MATAAYSLYGVSIRSDIPLGVPESGCASPDVVIECKPESWFAHVTQGLEPAVPEGDWYERALLPSGGDYLRWPGLFEFVVSPDGHAVAYRALGQPSLESFRTYLLGHVLSFALVKQGLEPLHATAVVIGTSAVAFLGTSGTGKSTLATAFVREGHRLLTDDLLLMKESEGRFYGFPGPPRLKLFRATAERLIPEQAIMAKMNPDSGKYVVAMPPEAAFNGPASMGCLVVLHATEVQGVLEFERISGAAMMLEFVAATFNRKIVGRDRLRRQFEAARLWSRTVPVFRLRYSWGLGVLTDAVRLVERQVQGVSAIA